MTDTARVVDGSGASQHEFPAAPAHPEMASPRSPSLVDRITGPYRTITRFLERRVLVRAARAVPRTLRFMSTTVVNGMEAADMRAHRHSLVLAVGVAADEAFLAMAMAPSKFPRRADYARVSAELADAKQMFSSRGWTTRPSSYHRTPPPLASEDVRTSRGWAMGLGYERIAYESGFSPRTGEPGAERWMGYEPNREAVAAIVRRPDDPDGPRPWLVCVHGFAMGYPFMDFTGLQTAKLHRALGVNVALPVLPLHGPRKVTRVSGEPFLSFDLMNTVHGFSQAIWDIRRLLSWIRAQGATTIGLYGVSLGAYVVALLAGIDDELGAVVAGIPVVDFPALFHGQSPAHIRARSIEHHIIGGPAEEVFAVVSPLSFAPKVPHDRRFIFAGHGDRLALPEHAHRLWEHWERPQISWYWGSHVGYLWSRQVATFLQDSVSVSGFGCPPPA